MIFRRSIKKANTSFVILQETTKRPNFFIEDLE